MRRGRGAASDPERNYDGARDLALEYQRIFGKGNYFLELQNHGMQEELEVNAGLQRIAQETGIGLIASNDVHYLRREDAYVQDVMMCIQTGHTVDETDRLRYDSSELYFKTADEMAALSPGLSGGACEHRQDRGALQCGI